MKWLELRRDLVLKGFFPPIVWLLAEKNEGIFRLMTYGLLLKISSNLKKKKKKKPSVCFLPSTHFDLFMYSLLVFPFPFIFYQFTRSEKYTMDPDILNVFTRPAALNQFLVENVITPGTYFVSQDRKRSKEWPELLSRKLAVQMNCLFFSSIPMALSATSKLCVCG